MAINLTQYLNPVLQSCTIQKIILYNIIQRMVTHILISSTRRLHSPDQIRRHLYAQ